MAIPFAASCVLALQHADEANFDKDGGELVASWYDLSGNGNHLVQATGDLKPLWSSAGVLFDGSDDYLDAAFTLVQPVTMVIRARYFAWSSDDRFTDGYAGNSGILRSLTTAHSYALYSGSPSTTVAGPAINTFVTWQVNWDSAGSDTLLQIDGDAPIISGENTGTSGMGGLTLGAAKTAGGAAQNWSRIEVTDVFVYNIALDEGQRARVRDYIDNGDSIPSDPAVVDSLVSRYALTYGVGEMVAGGVSVWEDKHIPQGLRNAPAYDGTGYLHRTALTGLVDGTEILCSFVFRTTSFADTQTIVDIGGRAQIYIHTAKRFWFYTKNAAGTFIARYYTTVAGLKIDTDYSVIWAWDQTDLANCSLYINGVDYALTEVNAIDTGETIDLGNTIGTGVGAIGSTGGAPHVGTINHVWFGDVWLDMDTQANRDLFFDDCGNPTTKPSDGLTAGMIDAGLSAPYIYLPGAADRANFGVNGNTTAGDFTVTSGPLVHYQHQGNNLLQATTSDQPTYDVATGLDFDGTNDHLRTATFSLPQPQTVYIKFQFETASTFERVYDGFDDLSMSFLISGTATEVKINAAGGDAQQMEYPGLDTVMVAVAIFDNTDSYLQIDATPSPSGDIITGSDTAAGFTLGERGSLAGNNADIIVEEVLIYKTHHTTDEIASMMSELGVGGGAGSLIAISISSSISSGLEDNPRYGS